MQRELIGIDPSTPRHWARLAKMHLQAKQPQTCLDVLVPRLEGWVAADTAAAVGTGAGAGVRTGADPGAVPVEEWVFDAVHDAGLALVRLG